MLSINSDLEAIALAMASPSSGLDIRDRTWLKLNIPNAFLGSDGVNWLQHYVQGCEERRKAKKLASKLLSAGYIQHPIGSKSSFSGKFNYVFSDKIVKEAAILNDVMGKF